MSDYDEQVLVDAAWLADNVGRADVQVLDVRPPAAYGAGHIAGAGHVPGAYLRPAGGDGDDLVEFAERAAGLLAAAGVNAGGIVVIYEDGPGMLASYAAWCVSFVGHPDVRVLAGGLAAWVSAGQPIVAERPVALPGSLVARRQPAALATADWLAAHLDDPTVQLVDARSPAEHSGLDQRAMRAGAIPGSINIEWTVALEPNGQYRPADQVRAELAAAGVSPDKDVVVYCQSGVRSAHLMLTLRALGYPRVRNYSGSWGEWASRFDLPIVNEP